MTLVLGVMGQGPVSRKAANSLLEDKLDMRDDVKFIFAITQRNGELPRAVRYTLDWAVDHNHPYDIVTDETSTALDDYETILAGAETAHKKIQRVGHKIARLLREAIEAGDEAQFLIAYKGGNNNDEDPSEGTDEDYVAFTRAMTEDLFAFDLADALEPLTYEEEPAAEETKAEPHMISVPYPGAEPDEGLLDWTLTEDERPDTREEAEKKGVRWAKATLRQVSEINSRKIGQMSLPEILDVMYPASVVDPANLPPSTLTPNDVQAPTRGDVPSGPPQVQQMGRTRRDIDLAAEELSILRKALHEPEVSDVIPLSVTVNINLDALATFIRKIVLDLAADLRFDNLPTK